MAFTFFHASIVVLNVIQLLTQIKSYSRA